MAGAHSGTRSMYLKVLDSNSKYLGSTESTSILNLVEQRARVTHVPYPIHVNVPEGIIKVRNQLNCIIRSYIDTPYGRAGILGEAWLASALRRLANISSA